MDGTLYYVHSDLLGSTVAVSDAAGQAVGRVQYDPYREVLTSTLPVTLTDRLFTGQRLDSSTGLYYYNARYYDPHLGRFIQPDTLVPDPLNPQAWNRFSYVYNNPTSYVDPSGHDGILVPLLIFSGAFLIGAGAGGYYAYHQGYGFESWQLYAYAGMGGLAGVAGAATGMWIEAALLPVGAAAWQAAAAGAAGGFAAGVVEQSILEAGGAAILGTEVSGERILLAGAMGGVTGGLSAGIGRAWSVRGVSRATPADAADIRAFGRTAEVVQAARGQRSFGAPFWDPVAEGIEEGRVGDWFVYRSGGKVTGAMKVVSRANVLEVKFLESLGGGGGTRLMQAAVRESIARGYGGGLQLYAAEQAIGFYTRLGPSYFDPATNLFIWNKARALLLLLR